MDFHPIFNGDFTHPTQVSKRLQLPILVQKCIFEAELQEDKKNALDNYRKCDDNMPATWLNIQIDTHSCQWGQPRLAEWGKGPFSTLLG